LTFHLGLMSGTSVDAIDACLIRCGGAKDEMLFHQQFSYPEKVRQKILSLIYSAHLNLDEFTKLHYEVGSAFAQAAKSTIRICHKKKVLKVSERIHSIGVHGQTVFHDPLQKRTLQLGEMSLVAKATGIATVSDFRAADTAVGGGGAPLLPFYHRRLFSSKARKGIAIHNLGGISNFTYLGEAKIFALDTGPANCWLDGAIQSLSHGKVKFDKAGKLSSLGRISTELLADIYRDKDIKKFRKQRAPKSTGRELFSPKFLQILMQKHAHLFPEDILRTLMEVTVDLIVESYEREVFEKKLSLAEIIFAGGGSKNRFLLKVLGARMPGVKLSYLEEHGLDSQALEAQAFAYYAKMALEKKSITFPSTTGCATLTVCGKVSYP